MRNENEKILFAGSVSYILNLCTQAKDIYSEENDSFFVEAVWRDSRVKPKRLSLTNGRHRGNEGRAAPFTSSDAIFSWETGVLNPHANYSLAVPVVDHLPQVQSATEVTPCWISINRAKKSLPEIWVRLKIIVLMEILFNKKFQFNFFKNLKFQLNFFRNLKFL